MEEKDLNKEKVNKQTPKKTNTTTKKKTNIQKQTNQC